MKTPILSGTAFSDRSRIELARYTGSMINRMVRWKAEPSMKYWRNLARLDQFMRLVIGSNLLPYQVLIDNQWPDLPVRQSRPVSIDAQHDVSLADYISEFRAYYWVEEGAYSPCLIYAPHIKLFFDLFFSHLVNNRSLPNSRLPDGRIQADVYNEFVEQLRQTATEQKLGRAMHNWEANGHGNRAKLERYLTGLFASSGSLTVMHLNVVHTTEYIDPNQIWAKPEKLLRDLALTRQIFLNRRSNCPALFAHMKGYVWAIETSLREGFSLHLTLFFDTAELIQTGNLNDHLDTPLAFNHIPASQRPKATFPQLVGEYIVRVATDGNGGYRICHHDRNYYRSWPYGVMDASDLPQLTEVLGHLAMKHNLVRPWKLPKGGRGQPRNLPFFGMGRLEARRSNAPARRTRTMHDGAVRSEDQ